MGVTSNYQKLLGQVPSNITIVLAGKTRTKDEILEAINAGATDIGENYVQEANKIKQELGEKAVKVKWHMIGSLQKNKINKALEVFDVIQSVDSLELAEAINKRADRKVSILLQVNIGDEGTKRGINKESVIELVKEIRKLDNLELKGLMTIEPCFQNPEDARPYFREMKKLFDELNLKTLSMGMSGSYKIAIEEGSNMIRVGTAVFGARE